MDVNFVFTFNSLDTLNAIRPVGPKWVLNYSGYAMEDPSGKVTIVAANGNQWQFNPSGGGYTAPNDYNATLVKTGTYDFQLTDLETETVVLYGRPSGVSTSASLFLSITDRWGVSVAAGYNSSGALTSITHSLGGTWDLIYNTAGRLERIDDPFSRSATFVYDSLNALREITDMGGLIYTFRYSNGPTSYTTTPEMALARKVNATPANQMFMTEIVYAPQDLAESYDANRTWYPLTYRFMKTSMAHGRGSPSPSPSPAAARASLVITAMAPAATRRPRRRLVAAMAPPIPTHWRMVTASWRA
jgi:YD repeat-containing protein